MRYIVMNIDVPNKNTEYVATLECYLPDNSPEIDMNRKRKSVVICPGGGYGMTSDREAEPIALKYASEGFNAFVLRYSVSPARFPVSLLELSKSFSIIRDNADEWNVNKDDIAVCGFSAGGHLAASLATLWHSDFITNALNIEFGSNKPNKAILCYPVITSGEHAHFGSFENLLGEECHDEKMLNLLSLEKQVSDKTPPTFLWHTFDDDCVPVENSLLMATALRAKKIPLEMHIYSSGVHGLALAKDVTAGPHSPWCINESCQNWIDMSIAWIKRF